MKEATVAFKVALSEKALPLAPDVWFSVQYELGLALWKLDRSDDALEAFRQSVYPNMRQDNPSYWASIQVSVAQALWVNSLKTSNRRQEIEAVETFYNLIGVLGESSDSHTLANAQSGLGVALISQGFRDKGGENLKKAISTFNKARGKISRVTHPVDWARHELNLAHTLTALGDLEKNASLFEDAIDIYNQVLLIAESNRDLLLNNEAVLERDRALESLYSHSRNASTFSQPRVTPPR